MLHINILTATKRLLRRLGLLNVAKRVASVVLDPSRKLVSPTLSYRLRAVLEQVTFADCEDVHDLPPIFHYWSNQHIRTALQATGFDDIDQFFVAYLRRAMTNANGETARFLSIGAGNCTFEVKLASMLVQSGAQNFVLECVDISAEALARGQALANSANVAAHIVPIRADFNTWTASGQYHAVIANQSLHHVVELEHLFDQIAVGLLRGGWFLTSDMIGRNGHARWPEALSVINSYWEKLPPSKRVDQSTGKQLSHFEDLPTQVGNFEGVRAQDILHLLVARFQFDYFFGFSNVVCPFVDRRFGANFNATDEGDQKLIDTIHAKDVALMKEGVITPTQMVAAMTNVVTESPTYVWGLSPKNAIRK